MLDTLTRVKRILQIGQRYLCLPLRLNPAFAPGDWAVWTAFAAIDFPMTALLFQISPTRTLKTYFFLLISSFYFLGPHPKRCIPKRL